MEDVYGFFMMLDFLAPFALLGGIGYLVWKEHKQKKVKGMK